MKIAKLSLFLLIMLSVIVQVQAQGTAFTYQGKLSDSNTPANGSFDIQFKLFDALSGGNQIGATITDATVAVISGVFTVELDFGASAFDGTPRYLEIYVRPAGSTDPYTVLSPRQAITSTPYALHSANASAADGLSSACAGCVTDTHIQTVDGAKITGNIAGSQISGAVPVESVPTGSNNYIQNAATLQKAGKTAIQQAAGFNVDGDGVVGGNFITNGKIGISTSAPTTSLHVAGGISWFQGDAAGLPTAAGKGIAIGYSNTSDLGYLFAYDYSTGSPRNLLLNHPGGSVGIGTLFPQGRFHVHDPGSVTPIFLSTGSGTEGAARFRIQADSGLFGQGKSLVIFDDIASQYRMVINGSGNIGIGTTTPTSKVEIAAQDALAITGFNPFLTLRDTGNGGRKSYIQGVNGDLAFIPQSFSGCCTAMVVKDISGNVGIGTISPSLKLTVQTAAGYGIIHTDGTVQVGTFVGNGSESTTGGWVGTRSNHPLRLMAADRPPSLEIATNCDVRTLGLLKLSLLASNATSPACFNVQPGGGGLGFCSSSLRYKTDVESFATGLEIIHRLRPIHFTWKETGQRDIGFAAEEVEKIEPMLIFHNEKGQIEGVRYNQLSPILVNAIKEQQAEISQLQRQLSEQSQQLKQQQNQIEMMKKLLCLNPSYASLCR